MRAGRSVVLLSRDACPSWKPRVCC